MTDALLALRMDIDPSALRASECYALLTSVIVPRPIAWVSTKDKRGHTNLAPFSYFTGIGSDPPMIALSISNRRDGSPKDTLRILQETGVFCVNVVEEHDAERMNASSFDYTPDQSEIEVGGIEIEACKVIDGVRVRSSRASLECRLVDVHRYGRKVGINLVVAEVVHFFVDDALVTPEGTAAPERIEPLARLGDKTYAVLGRRLEIPRPKIG
jgi:flavin reductase (DIM6/NTAB) family NADH-FMN oxidoreductase RutF